MVLTESLRELPVSAITEDSAAVIELQEQSPLSVSQRNVQTTARFTAALIIPGFAEMPWSIASAPSPALPLSPAQLLQNPNDVDSLIGQQMGPHTWTEAQNRPSNFEPLHDCESTCQKTEQDHCMHEAREHSVLRKHFYTILVQCLM